MAAVAFDDVSPLKLDPGFQIPSHYGLAEAHRLKDQPQADAEAVEGSGA
jgi:hypothetical protein